MANKEPSAGPPEVEWNQTGSEYPSTATVHGLFEDQVERAPEAIAVVCGNARLTYRQLNERANQLARFLVRRGVKPEELVGLCVERSPQMLVGLLGILKAGGAYVPLDPDYPRQRLEFMLEDSAARVVVTQESLLERLPDGGFERVRMDADWSAIENEKTENPEGDATATATAGNLAYVIYTSGSTGKPKGVAIEHRSVVNLLLSMQERVGLGDGDVLLAVTTLSFDIAGLELYLPLHNGACVTISSRENASDGRELSEELRRYGATVMQATPVTWRLLLEAGWEGGLLAALCGGEALSGELADQLLEKASSVWNLYGPTETTIWSTASRLEPGMRPVTIGTPLANTQVFILDDAGNPVPLGDPGQLHIGGMGLARGYWNRPELTEKVFIRRALMEDEPIRLYATGDLGRYRNDGTIEYLGRLDNQVKLRGYRIELGEIETVLRENPAVREAVAVVREDGGELSRLVAYIVPSLPDSRSSTEPIEILGTQSGQTSQWREIWDQQYTVAAGTDPTFNFTGWNNSYTGQTLPFEDVREWVDQTVERVHSLEPRRVLEIGCGTGLLLFRIAPKCEEYLATDFSRVALDGIGRTLPRLGIEGVNLMERDAANFDGIPAEHFDAVVINSVAQYFPSIDYLVAVLKGAVDTLRPGGCVFVGDVRSLPLLEAFHASVRLFRAPASMAIEEFRQSVSEEIAGDSQLVIAPGFFTALGRSLSKIRHVQILPRRGVHDNELNRFRFDAILHTGDPVSPVGEIPWREWDREKPTISELRKVLEQESPEALGVSRVPNARVAGHARILPTAADGLRSVGELREALARSPVAGIHPEEIWAIGRDLPYAVAVSWADTDAQGRFDVIFRRRNGSETDAAVARWEVPSRSEPAVGARPWTSYANQPLAQALFRGLVPELRRSLESRLPEYMIPSAFVRLDRLPLTPNGKLDRRALPAPDRSRPELPVSFVAPRNPSEAKVARIFGEVLGLESVGVDDDFFDLGGHSLSATQVISRLRQVFGVEISVRDFFVSRTVASLSRTIEEAPRDSPTSAPGPRRMERSDRIPLSYAQQRLWFLEQLEPGGFAYNVPQAVRVKGRLDRDTLRRALQAVAARHESLRTSFPTVEGSPIQVIAPEVEIDVPTLDLTGMPEEKRESEAARILRKEAERPFDLAHGPLFRAGLLRLSEEHHILFWTMHHIVTDGWSMEILVEELTAFYEEFSGGRRARLAELPIQYADFAAWQRGWLSGKVLDEQLSYWRKQLSGIPVLELPTDRPRPPVQSFRGARAALWFSTGLTEGLKELSRREGATLYMTLLAAFGALLGRYAGQEDVVIGSPIAGRNRAETEGLIGFFVNTLVLRTDLSGDPSFRELVGRVRDAALEAYAHQDLPFEKLVEELQPKRSLGRNPLFQVLFALQNTTPASFELSGLKLTPQPLEARTTRFDLEVHLSEDGNALSCAFEYSTDLFDGSTIRRMLGHFENLLESALADPDGRLSALSLMSDGERRQVLVEWNETEVEYPRGATVHGLFEGQVERTPEAEALVFGRERLTYRQLNERANRLAAYLKRRGVGPEVLVGVCVERSLEMVVGLLGILKAGGAYVPLDPLYPPGRVELMLQDSGARVVLTQASLSGSLPEGGLERVCLDADWPEIARESAENPAGGARAENRAYVIYTSGSTGKPKGVAMPHRALVNLIAWQRDASRNPAAKTLQFASLNFDVSFQEIFSTWCAGGTLLLVSDEVRRDASALWRLLSSESVERLFLPFVALQHLAEAAELDESDASSLREVITAGEQLQITPPIARLFRGRVPRLLQNQYGPSETHVATAFTLLGDPSEWPVLPPIGRPIANTRIYLLDRDGQPVPVGVTGELNIGGCGVAHGYWNRPELTAEKFVPDSFSDDPGARLYKTGDLARYREDGEIEFLGRLDHQVKIRGYRVEPGEIEHALGRHPEIQACAVAAWEEEPGDKRLVGYVVPRDGSPPSVTRLRAFLKTTLPDYMVPSTFLFLDALPLTPNGKLDRRALPAPQLSRPALEDLFVAPRTPVEATLSEIWREVLKVEQVGIHDNFFDLGGHSLLATLISARLENAFPVAPPLRALFENPTVAGLAAAIEELQGADPGPRRPVIQAVSRQASSREAAPATGRGPSPSPRSKL